MSVSEMGRLREPSCMGLSVDVEDKVISTIQECYRDHVCSYVSIMNAHLREEGSLKEYEIVGFDYILVNILSCLDKKNAIKEHLVDIQKSAEAGRTVELAGRLYEGVVEQYLQLAEVELEKLSEIRVEGSLTKSVIVEDFVCRMMLSLKTSMSDLKIAKCITEVKGLKEKFLKQQQMLACVENSEALKKIEASEFDRRLGMEGFKALETGLFNLQQNSSDQQKVVSMMKLLKNRISELLQEREETLESIKLGLPKETVEESFNKLVQIKREIIECVNKRQEGLGLLKILDITHSDLEEETELLKLVLAESNFDENLSKVVNEIRQRQIDVSYLLEGSLKEAVCLTVYMNSLQSQISELNLSLESDKQGKERDLNFSILLLDSEVYSLEAVLSNIKV